MTLVTAAHSAAVYLLLIDMKSRRTMNKLYAFVAACTVFAPVVFIALHQAAQIVS